MSQPLRVDQMDDLPDKIREGLTEDEDQNLEQAQRMKSPDGAEVVRQATEIRYLEGTRVPVPVFVATDDDDTAWLDGVHDDRVMRGAITSYPPDVVEAIRSGHICISCLEPHPDAFPVNCSLCGFEMKALQAISFAMHFEGQTNLGPSKPLQAYADEREAENQKIAFDRKLAEGASPMKGLRRGA